MVFKRTFGWIQNPGDIRKLKSVVSVFLKGSRTNEWLTTGRLPLLLSYNLISKEDFDLFIKELTKNNIEIDYGILKGKGVGQNAKRKDAICTGIIQAVIDGQKNKKYVNEFGECINIKKPYTDDWTADGFLRWAISCGFVDYNSKTDKCKISELGIRLACSDDTSSEERAAFTIGLLSYPPVVRILTLLQERDWQTKFELGGRLGFKGELGFTSIPQEVFLCDYCEAKTSKDKSNIRANEEGDADKYARGIASWCSQMGWVISMQKNVTGVYRGKKYEGALQSYSLTRDGERALIIAKGNSSNKRLNKIVYFEMLASNKAYGSDYLRYERAAVIKAISSGYKSMQQIKASLCGRNLDIDEVAIKDHIDGLINIGLNIVENDSKYRLFDNIIKLDIQEKNTYVRDDINVIVDRVRPVLKNLDHRYLELISLAYSDSGNKFKKNFDAREFEIKTAELFTKELDFEGMRLGEANRPDVIISMGDMGTIIDNKSYKDGFSISKHSADEMSRYVNENIRRSENLNPNRWWDNFNKHVSKFTFLFITSYAKGDYQKQLEYISEVNNNTKGAIIGVENLLYLSEAIKSKMISHNDFYNKFNNSEIVININE